MSDEQEFKEASQFANAAFDIIVLAASAGGMLAIGKVLEGLPETFPAGIVVVQHVAPAAQSYLPEILAHHTPLAVKHVTDGEMIFPATVFIAPPDYHVLIKADHSLSLSHAPAVHFVRPSADLLFESAASVYQERVIAVVLTGTGMDGAAGVKAIKLQGGTVIAQDAATSQFFGMPGEAIRTGSVDFILPLGDISAMLCTLVIPVVPGGWHEQK